jgi:glycosyltransferase involved in cell wall biosynthesis
MASIGNNHESWLLLNEAFPDTIPAIYRQFDGLIPASHIVTFGAPQRGSRWNFFRRRKPSSCLTRDEALSAINPDVIYIASLFEPVESPIRGGTVPTAVTLYDLIPLIYARHYLDSSPQSTWYHGKLDELKRANILLAISNHTRSEAIEYLGLPGEKIVTIDAGIDSRFRVVTLSADQERDIRARMGLDLPFVMYTGGIDWRKNVNGLIQAFALLPRTLRAEYQLAVVCAITSDEEANLLSVACGLGLAKKDVVFTGYVADDDLVKLYNLCHLFIFPSLHEGFGLPIIEAMACGAPVIGSNTTSIPEIIGCRDALFDPTRPAAISEAMMTVLMNDEFRQSLRHHGLAQSRLFTWENSARRALSALETLVNQ